MSVGRITSHVVDELTSTSVDLFLWDSDLSGFGVRVTPAGAKSYVYQYRLGGRASVTRRYTIGRHRSPWTAQSARARAQHLAKQVEKGKDPATKRRERRRKEAELRFDKYLEVFTNEYLRSRWKGWERTEAMLVRHALPAIGTKKLSDIRRADLAGIYHRLEQSPSVARAVHAALRKMFRWAMSRDDLKHSPADGVEAPPTMKPRTRYLTDAELRDAWITSVELPTVYSWFVRLLMLTGQRRGEVAGLDWSELNRGRAEWALPAERTKNGNPHIIPLSDQSVAVLDDAAGSIEWPAEGLVMPSSFGTQLSAFSKVKAGWDCSIVRARQARGINSEMAAWRFHDLRRTVATGMQALQVRTEIIEAVLNHLSGTREGIVSVYQRYDYAAEKRHALSTWGRHIERMTG